LATGAEYTISESHSDYSSPILFIVQNAFGLEHLNELKVFDFCGFEVKRLAITGWNKLWRYCLQKIMIGYIKEAQRKKVHLYNNGW